MKAYDAIVIGSSAGGMYALKNLIQGLKPGFRIPLIIVQHLSPHSDNYLAHFLDQLGILRVKEADERESIKPGHAYIAPPNFHLLIENDHTFSLTVEEKVNYARPSIDVLFETAAGVFRDRLIGIILTGANHDGANGIKSIRSFGGFTIAQNPATAESDIMPKAAIATGKIDKIWDINEISGFLNSLSNT
ncbi:MAG: chemotaxis protein CheB [Bacteroidales bacterium]|jgi:two-component system chemotaxis response regulator CheB|nr:chemotaxis protein CheB [Bacteroidales bacterium]HOI33476.1 chemotaxis protein CheB [Bacteroidales bacterium]